MILLTPYEELLVNHHGFPESRIEEYRRIGGMWGYNKESGWQPIPETPLKGEKISVIFYDDPNPCDFSDELIEPIKRFD